MSDTEVVVAPEIIGELETPEQTAPAVVQEVAETEVTVEEPVAQEVKTETVEPVEPVTNGEPQEDTNAKRKAEDEVDDKPESKRMNPGDVRSSSDLIAIQAEFSNIRSLG